MTKNTVKIFYCAILSFINLFSSMGKFHINGSTYSELKRLIKKKMNINLNVR